MDYAKILRDNLRDVMRQKGFTQAWIAEQTQITEATVSRYLSGVHSPKIEYIAKMAAAMGVSIDYLMGLSSSPIPNEPPSDEIRILIAAYKRADAHTKKMIWMQLEPVMSEGERELAPKSLKEQRSETA